MATHNHILGIDFGNKKIGLAIAHSLTKVARPLKVLPFNGAFWQSLNAIIEEWEIAQLVVGLPLDMDGKEQQITRQTRNFAKKAIQLTQLPLAFSDERLSSFEAERLFQKQRQTGQAKAKDKAQIDALAAQVILQSWLDQQ